MNQEAIFVPVCVLGLWTGVVLMLTGGTRVRAIRAGRLRQSAFKNGESPEVPADVGLPNRNLMNLLEMPVLFYVVALSFFVTKHVTSGVVNLCWTYAALRLLHSVVHLTYNRVFHRFLVFVCSNVVLLVLWITFLRSVTR
jgi:hypothetical protein